MRYCESPYLFQRRLTREVVVGDPRRGGVILGGHHPVVVQSMLTCDTMDTAACVQQTLDLVAVGCQIVRITAPTVKDAANLEHIAADLRRRDCWVPLVADIHFKPDAALEAARWVEMVRINPGNYADSKKFAIKEYTDEQYAAELKRIEEKFTPLVKLCRELGRALRIGTNHGSLSDRIMNRYGDTPRGMVESALEFARIARAHDFHNFKFSMKSSNPKVMIECYRLLVARLAEEGPDWNYPIHLGVTEAGEGEDGRIKSAIGIGSLLCDGLGDTIRVSLTEDSPREIEVCRDLLAQIPRPGLFDTAGPVLRVSVRPLSLRTPAHAGNRPRPRRHEMRGRTDGARGGDACDLGQGRAEDFPQSGREARGRLRGPEPPGNRSARGFQCAVRHSARDRAGRRASAADRRLPVARRQTPATGPALPDSPEGLSHV
jgi:(E)-4-hydroxy-3-methylbut-2-enyl-diphosphate synthase